MRGLTMPFQLTVPALMRRAETLSGAVEIVSRHQRGVHRYTYAEMIRRAKRLAVALGRLNVQPGDRVATLNWNNHDHLEAYFGVPSLGAVLHTLNPRFQPEELTYCINHAEDTVLIVDRQLLPLFERIRHSVGIRHVLVSGGPTTAPFLSYEALIAEADEHRFCYQDLDEWDAAAMCYSSGTTGRPKAALYSHRALALMAMHWTAADTAALGHRDVILAVVPMFHINGWCLPFAAALVGAKLVLPGSAMGPEELIHTVAAEKVTISAGVPAVWASVLHTLEREADTDQLSSLRRLVLGGSAVPERLAQAYHDRHCVTVIQAWGMTETTSIATASRPNLIAGAARPLSSPSTQGVAMPFVEVRARRDDGELVEWDGESVGELEIRGATVIAGYHRPQDGEASCLTSDHWLRTGDIVSIDAAGAVQIRDRAKDLIKSGGEWISSVALENALMNHPAVAEAAVIAVPDRRWDERPLAVVVVKQDAAVTAEQLNAHLAGQFAKWWLPDAYRFVDQIPRTSTGKFQKTRLRAQFAARLTGTADETWPNAGKALEE